MGKYFAIIPQMKIHLKDFRCQVIFFICKLWSCCIIHSFMVTHKQSAHGVGFIYISSNRPRPSWLHVTFLCNISRDFIFYLTPLFLSLHPRRSLSWLAPLSDSGRALTPRPSVVVVCTLVVTSSVKVKMWKYLYIYILTELFWLKVVIHECNVRFRNLWYGDSDIDLLRLTRAY